MERRSASWCTISVLAPSVLALVVAFAPTARAQDEERPSDARGGYAWGEGGGDGGSGAQLAEDPLRIMGFVGAGVGVRLVANLDPPFRHDRLTPAYMDIGGAVFFPGTDFRHGVSLFASTNLSASPTVDGADGVQPGQQWALAPGYSFLLPFQRLLGMDTDMLQLQGRIAIPILFSSSVQETGALDVTVGVELGVALHIKVLAGFGFYVEAQADLYGGANETVHPTVSLDGGLMIDYEVLP